MVNCAPLQLRWAQENGLRAARPLGAVASRSGIGGRALRLALLHQVARAQIERFRPDVVYVQDARFFHPAEIRSLRRHGRLFACQIATIPPPARWMKAYDLVFSSLPNLVARFRADGIESRLLRIAFDTRVLGRLRASGVDPSPAAERAYAVTFVGGLDRGVHATGTNFLEDVCTRLDVDVWGYGAEQLAAGSPILRHYHGEAWGLDMYRVLARSRIVINRHIAAAEGYANNMRLFEATGTGALLATENAPNLSEMFEPGREVVTYSSADELVARVERMLADTAARVAIATTGTERTLREHTYARRIAELAKVLEARIAT